MIKFSHSVFALPFALIATFLAGRHLPGGLPRPGQVVLIVGCMVLARSLAMTFNRIVDYEIDAKNPRTKDRPLQTGRLSRRMALFFSGCCIGGFMACCTGFYWIYANPWPAVFGMPLLAYLCGYSYSKRFTKWSHFYLGSAIALSPVAAWVAIHPASVGAPAIVLMAAVTLWIGGFDIIYACQDIDVDRTEGLYSLPSRLGPAPALWIARGAHAAAVALLTWLAWLAGLGAVYLAGVAGVALLLLFENLLVRADDFSRVNLAFFTVNGVVSVGLGLMAVVDILLSLSSRPGPPVGS
ncbi:MAG: UbiA family prenyltransferase [Phycisphaerae bacterium]|nr:UbiA family prenyltransferase [Phycisphaerae bacterium]